MAVPGANGSPYHLCVPNTDVCGFRLGHRRGIDQRLDHDLFLFFLQLFLYDVFRRHLRAFSLRVRSGAHVVAGCDVLRHRGLRVGLLLLQQELGQPVRDRGDDCVRAELQLQLELELEQLDQQRHGHHSASPGTVGPGGGTLATLSFAIVGDTRPPNEDDTTGYPTSVITKIYQDIEAASPRPAFAITTGDYMFASPSHTPGTQATQMGYYMGARNLFSNIVFPAMGNHECDGATGDNCYACGSACNNVGGSCINNLCETPNFTVFQSAMLAPIGQALPYYTINVNSTSNAWTSKFVFIACNMWTPAQATWLDSTLSTPTTYTFVVRHESRAPLSVPCVTASPSADSITTSHPFTLIIAGHTHTYAYYASEKLVVVGNGGAPQRERQLRLRDREPAGERVDPLQRVRLPRPTRSPTRSPSSSRRDLPTVGVALAPPCVPRALAVSLPG